MPSRSSRLCPETTTSTPSIFVTTRSSSAALSSSAAAAPSFSATVEAVPLSMIAENSFSMSRRACWVESRSASFAYWDVSLSSS